MCRWWWVFPGALCLVPLRHGSPLNLEQGWRPAKLSNPLPLLFAVLGLQASMSTHGFYMWVLGFKLRFSCSHSKCCIHQVNFLPHLLCFIANYKETVTVTASLIDSVCNMVQRDTDGSENLTQAECPEPLTHACTHECTCSLTCALIYSFTHSLTYSYTHAHTHSHTHSLTL